VRKKELRNAFTNALSAGWTLVHYTMKPPKI
jgi:hypothetical protein